MKDVAAIAAIPESFLLELRAGAPGHDTHVTLFPKVPLAEAISIYEMRGVEFADDGSFKDPDGNSLRLHVSPLPAP